MLTNSLAAGLLWRATMVAAATVCLIAVLHPLQPLSADSPNRHAMPSPAERSTISPLLALLPDSLHGMLRSDTGVTREKSLGVASSSTHAIYRGENGERVRIDLIDVTQPSALFTLAGGLLEGATEEANPQWLTAANHAAVSHAVALRSAADYDGDATIDGRTVHERVDTTAKRAWLRVILTDRLEVMIAGDGIGMRDLEAAYGRIDFDRLERLHDL